VAGSNEKTLISKSALLSAKAGLRAGEIANLTWAMVLGPTGQISGSIELHDTAAKKRQRPSDPDTSAAW
jgi:hypothetical protein